MNLLDPLLRVLRPAPQMCRWPEGCTTVVGPEGLICPEHQQAEHELTTTSTKETKQ